MTERCRVYDIDGQPVVVRGSGPLDSAGQAALTELVRAAKAKHRAEHSDEELEELGRRQRAAIARIRERASRRRA